MLKRSFEWYRMVDTKPDDETIQKRKASVMDLLEKIGAEENPDLLIACTAAAVNGLETGFSQDSKVVMTTVEAIRRHQPAFPEDLSENALDLRACCAVTVGELLARSDKAEQERTVQLAASLLVAGIPIRPAARERHVRKVLEELAGAAYIFLDGAAAVRRQRRVVSLDRLAEIGTPGDIPTFWKNLMPAIRKCFTEMEENAAADREELDVLWWLYTGFSEAAQKPLADLDPGAAALCCGGELANLVLTPPGENIRQMVRRAAEGGRKASALVGASLEQLAPQWDDAMLALLTPNDATAQELARDYSALLPLSWLCWRLRDSQHSPGWGKEFEVKTGISSTHKCRPADWAVQVFNERIAQRIYADIMEK